jgi:hypothetical protein
MDAALEFHDVFQGGRLTARQDNTLRFKHLRYFGVAFDLRWLYKHKEFFTKAYSP